MKIVQERNGAEIFVDLLINEKEFNLLKEFMIINKSVLIFDKLVSFGIKLGLQEDFEDDHDELF